MPRWAAVAFFKADKTALSGATYQRFVYFVPDLPGDYELAQMLVAIAVVACLPYCQMRGGNVRVDFFTARLPRRARNALDAIGAASVGLVGAVFAWRMCYGLLDLRQSNEQSMILELPSWYPYVLVIPCFALLGLAGFYTAWRRLRATPDEDAA